MKEGRKSHKLSSSSMEFVDNLTEKLKSGKSVLFGVFIDQKPAKFMA